MRNVKTIHLILTCILITEVSFGQTFTQITSGDIVSDGGSSYGAAWGDYDNDGHVDLFVANGGDEENFLYHNNGDGTFTKITTGDISTDAGSSSTGSWGDYNNDGNLDLFVSSTGDPALTNFLYSNNGDGSFTKITSNDIVNQSGDFFNNSWGDYNGDGDLDLFVAVGGNNFLYANNNDGTFTRITVGDIVSDGGSSFHGSWADYDNDGDLDLFVANGGFHDNQNNFLYSNNGNGTFSKITTGDIVNDGGRSMSGSWGDYDNDGDLDLFVTNGASSEAQNNFLYSNDGDGTFTKVTTGEIVNDGGYSWSSSWGDIDNDGDLDLYVTNDFSDIGKANFLYSNNGDGSFTKITNGHVVTDENISLGCGWADYDNDGDIDLFIAIDNGNANLLYTNDGSSNKWINIKCIGTSSNKSAIGARVQVKANISGLENSQIQELSGQTGGGEGSQNSLNAEFGLGDAEIIDEVIVKWPSGATETFADVLVDQFVTVREGNASPVGMNDAPITNEDELIIIDVLGNDTDADSDLLTVTLDETTTHGELVLNDDYTVTYTPNENYFGADSFSYNISDGFLGGTSSATATIDVTSVNDAPVLVEPISDQNTIYEYIFTFDEGTFEDVEDSELTYTATLADNSPLPSWLSFDGASRTFSGTPDNGVNTYAIKVIATDSEGLSVSDEFNVDLLISNLEEINEWKGVSIYPNPTTEFIELNIQNNYKGEVSISLYDHRGKQLLNEVINKINSEVTYRFNLVTKPNGLYLIRVESGDGIKQLKALKY